MSKINENFFDKLLNDKTMYKPEKLSSKNKDVIKLKDNGETVTISDNPKEIEISDKALSQLKDLTPEEKMDGDELVEYLNDIKQTAQIHTLEDKNDRKLKKMEKTIKERLKEETELGENISNREIIIALRKCMGFVSRAAKLLKCDVTVIHDRLKTNKNLRELKDMIDETLLDTAELQLMKGIKEGNADLIKFYLQNKGKKRGYNDKANLADMMNKPINITVQPAQLPDMSAMPIVNVTPKKED